MCLPRVDSPSIFGALLDRDAGSFRLGPDGATVPAARRYLPGTMVLETSWGTGSGWIVVRDVLLIGNWHHEHDRSHTHRRAPTDYDADHVLLRTVRCVNGNVQLLLDCEPKFDYGREPAKWRYSGDGYNQGSASSPDGTVELTLTTDLRLGFEGSRATARHMMREGEVIYCALSWSEHAPPKDIEEAYERQVWTAHHWQHWLDRGTFPDHPWRTFLQRSALTLKGLTYAPSGALLAAATTSLPETPQGERNWDYRYSWIRDSTFMLWALLSLGFEWEANDFFYFIADVAAGEEKLQVMYGLDGERKLDEYVLDHLEGYERARPVRVGNAAYEQRQHDVWGALLDSVYLHTRSRDSLDDRVWRILSRQVEQAIENWREPDRGIWEVRGEPKHFTSSKVFCWVACDRGARLAELREDFKRATRWREAADEIKADVLEHGVDERGVFVQHYETDALDAALLLLPLMRFLPPDDERIRATVFAIADELTEGGLVLRYRTEETDDGLDGQGGHLPHLLLLACLGTVRDRRAGPGAVAVRAAARLRQPARPLRRGDRPPDRPPSRQLPPGVHSPGAHQRRHARDPGRRRGGRVPVAVVGVALRARRHDGRRARSSLLLRGGLVPCGKCAESRKTALLGMGSSGVCAVPPWRRPTVSAKPAGLTAESC